MKKNISSSLVKALGKFGESLNKKDCPFILYQPKAVRRDKKQNASGKTM